MSAAGKFGRGLQAACVRLVFMAAAVLCCGVTVFALDPSLDISQYAHTAWKVRDGFARGGIYAIAQTPDGYLWLGTEFGLLRFDGVRVGPWQPPNGGEQLPSNSIFSLLVTDDGTLWIGTLKGLASWKDGKLTQYQEVSSSAVGSLLEDRERTVWVGTYGSSKSRLCAIRGGKVECTGAGTFGTDVFAVYEDHGHNLWVSSRTGLWRWAPGPPKRYAFPRGVVEANSLIEDDAGARLLATNDGLKQVVAGRIENYPLPGITGHFRPTMFVRSGDGSLWIGSDQGLLHLHHGNVDGFTAIDGLSGDSVRSIFRDREGTVWVGTLDGLDRFREYPIPTISRNQGLSNSTSWSVQATPDGSIWVGTADGLNRWTNGQVTIYRGRSASAQTRRGNKTDLSATGAATGIANSGLARTPQSLGLDDRGRLWASTVDGVFYFERGRFIQVQAVPGGNTLSIAGHGRGDVWILQRDALFHWSPNAAIQQIPRSQFGQKTSLSMLPDREPGGVWLGFYEGGVVYLKGGKVVRSYGPADGLGDGRVNDLRFDSRGAVWAATEGGLSRIKDGHIDVLNGKEGLPCDEVHWSIEDDDYNVWAYMPCGLVRIAPSELGAWINDPKHVLKTTVFENTDGVRSVGVSGGYGPHVTKSPDGRIWFVPRDGISVIDPRHLPVNTLPPPVLVEQITADRKTYDATSDRIGRLRLPPQVRDVQIDYTALSLVAPEKMLFRYKLEGRDRDWQNVGNRRQAFYTDLPPGNYRFRVAASNNSGVWNEAGAFLDFSVAPAYYQTTWFRLSLVAAFLGLLWALHQLRLHQLEREFNAGLEGQLSERMRVARELHDTLLQSFQGLLLMFQTVLYALPQRPVEAKQTLETAVDQAAQAITEGRDAVHALRSSTAITHDLAQSIAALGQGLAAREDGGESAAFRIQVEGTPRSINPIIRDEVYRIAGEALRNAFNHARARQIEVEIDYRERQLRLHIRDDGKGLETNIQPPTGHFGLRGMQERAQVLGGRLDVWSEVGTGTEVDLTIPASVAYANLPNSRRFWFLRRVTASRP